MLPVNLSIVASAWHALKVPDSAPFVDPVYLPVFLWMVTLSVALNFGVLTAGLVLRKVREPMNWLVHTTVQVFSLSISYLAYAIGLYTSPVGFAFVAALVGGGLVFNWKPIAGATASALVIGAGTTIASQAGFIPYAPLFRGPVVLDQHLTGWWLSRVASPALFVAVLCVSLFFHILSKWRTREDRLQAAYAELRDREEQLAAAYAELRESHGQLAQLEKAIATAQVGITITDLDGKIAYTNRAEAEMHGYRPEELLGQPVRILAPPVSARPMTKEELRRARTLRRESVNVRKNGSQFPVHLVSDVISDADGEPVGLVTISEDITSRKQIEEALRRSEERYALAIRGAADGIWDWDIERDEVFYSDRWKAMLGFEDHEIGSTPDDWLNRIHPDERESVKLRITAHLEGHTPQFECEYRALHKDGDYRWMLARGLAVRDERGNARRMAGSQTDITERSLLDPLTGLPNRTLFMDRLHRAFERASQPDRPPFALLLLGLNRFNNVNETLGRQVGDQLLFMVAARLQQRVGKGNSVARLGGDEFTILLEDLTEHGRVARVADQILEELKNPFKLYGRELFITGSIGIALYDGKAETPEVMLRDADTALRRAKRSGTGRHELFDADMRRVALTRFELESDLRRAVQRGELILEYQPIVQTRDSRVAGFEALVRWRHPVRGLLAPAEFISLAEETGQINAVGQWVLQEACRQMQIWYVRYPEQWPMSVSVNLSGIQFTQPDLVQRIDDVLRETRLDRRSLRMEITESVLMHDADSAALTLTRLKELGITLCMDDFGTGYSSLSYLNRFPFNTMKIDKSFVQKIGETESDIEIVRAMIDLAHNLRMDVVAEGVETEEQLLALAECGCDAIQGFYYYRPLSAIEAEKLLARRQGRPTVEVSSTTRKRLEE